MSFLTPDFSSYIEKAHFHYENPEKAKTNPATAKLVSNEFDNIADAEGTARKIMQTLHLRSGDVSTKSSGNKFEVIINNQGLARFDSGLKAYLEREITEAGFQDISTPAGLTHLVSKKHFTSENEAASVGMRIGKMLHLGAGEISTRSREDGEYEITINNPDNYKNALQNYRMSIIKHE